MPDETAPSMPTSTTEANFNPATDTEIANLLSYEATAPKTPSNPTPTPASNQTPTSTQPEQKTEAPVEQKTENENESPLDKIARTKTVRDLTDIPPEHQKLFRAMSNEAFEYFMPLYKKLQGFDIDKVKAEQEQYRTQVEELSKSRFYDHPDAYTLSEDYQSLSNVMNTINQHQHFYEQQLAAAEEGKPVSFIQRNEKGVFVVGPPQQVTPQVKAQLQQQLIRLATDAQRGEVELGQLRKSYVESYKGYEKSLSGIFDQLFGKHKDTLKTVAEKQLQTFPPHLRNRQEGQLLAYAMAAMQHVLAFKKVEQTKAAGEKIGREVAAAAGPTSDKLTTSSGVVADSTDAGYKQFLAKFA